MASLLATGCGVPGPTDSDGSAGDGDGDVVGDGDGDVVGDGDGDVIGDGDGDIVGDGDGDIVGDGDGDIVGDGDGDIALPPKDVCVPGIAPSSQIPRLKNVQYDNTIRDLLGLTALSGSGGAKPSSLLEFDHSGSMTELGWSSYKTVANLIAAQVMADPALKANFLSCDEATEGCLSSTIADFGRRAFRRPLHQGEIDAFNALLASGPSTTPTGAAAEVAELLLYGFLVSPSFIMRAEAHEDVVDAEGNYVLSSHEVASRLSYLLWGSMPDDELSAAADADALTAPAQILAQAQRMMGHENARERVAEFHRNYLLMSDNSRWSSVDKDPTLFPEFNDGLVGPMAQETESFFDYITFNDGTFQDLLTSPVAFPNAEMADLYGIDSAPFGEAPQQAELDPNERPGFLTRLGFLNSYSGATRTSPILRGAFITKEVLGIEVAAPPPGSTDQPLPDSTDLDTNRKQVAQQTAGITCADCHHNFINPPGFVMESFDTIGRFRTTESSGVQLDTVAEVIVDDAPVTISSPFELMTAIANSPGAQHYYAERWVSFAYERGANGFDTCTVDTIGGNMTAGGYSIVQLIVDLTQTESFRVRAMEN